MRGHTGQCDTVGELIVQHNIKEVDKKKKQPIAIPVSRRRDKVDCDPRIATTNNKKHSQALIQWSTAPASSEKKKC